METMNCELARERLLEADPAELRGGTASDLGRHLDACPACRALARRILQGYDALDAGLAALDTQAGRRKARWWRLAPVPLAAAAVLALLLTRPSAPPPAEPVTLAELMFRARPVASPPAGKQAIVIEHRDMVVVWLY